MQKLYRIRVIHGNSKDDHDIYVEDERFVTAINDYYNKGGRISGFPPEAPSWYTGSDYYKEALENDEELDLDEDFRESYWCGPTPKYPHIIMGETEVWDV